MMPVMFFPITPAMEEMGVVQTAMLMQHFDEDEGELILEACARVDRPLTERQSEHLMELCRDAAHVASAALSAFLMGIMRGNDVKVSLTFGVYYSQDGE